MLFVILGIAFWGCVIFALWSIIARCAFSYTGKKKLAKKIVEGTAKYVVLPEGGTGLDVGCGSGYHMWRMIGAGAHLAVGAFAGQKNLDLLIAIGKDAAYYAEGAAAHMDAAKIQYFPDKNEFLTHLPGLLAAGDVVLVKASRGMALEEIADRMLAAQEAADSEAER